MELAAQGSANGYSQGSSREGYSNGYRPSSDIFNTSTSSPPAGPGEQTVSKWLGSVLQFTDLLLSLGYFGDSSLACTHS